MAKRVTRLFNLGTTQSGVDFVDVDVNGDVPVFIDPPSIRAQSGDWVDACVASLQTYFQALIDAIRADDEVRIRELILPLQEPNETHLGVSRGNSRGRSLGSAKKAAELIANLRNSKAAKSGFLSDLEDTALLVDGVDKDIVSDITTCVIRRHLIQYTQEQCRFHGIPMEVQDPGPIWDDRAAIWTNSALGMELPRAADDRLLLVPKSIVRVKLSVDKGKYYRGYIRPFFEEIELKKAHSEFVYLLKDDRRKVRKGKLDKKVGTKKSDVTDHTEKFPSALDAYKKDAPKRARAPMSDNDMHVRLGTPTESLDDILEEVLVIPPGKAGANSYHRAIAKLLTALFDTQLGNERIETPLHQGLKRIDITYDNIAAEGFFDWLRRHHQAALVVVECKNYGKEMGNPEFDQIAMRFSPKRGQFGLLVCRSVQNMSAALARAKAIADDSHGYVVLLTDDDLKALVAEANQVIGWGPERYAYATIRGRFDALIGVS